MARFITISRADTGRVLVQRAQWCASFWSRWRGVQFRRTLPAEEGVVLVYKRPTHYAAVHTVGVPFPLGVLWLDGALRIVEQCETRPWWGVYRPQTNTPIHYIVEAPPHALRALPPRTKLLFQHI